MRDEGRDTWDVERFRQYVRDSIDKCYVVTSSTIVLRSFYIANVDRPAEVTVRMFEWLRAMAEQESKNYKSKLSIEGRN